MLKKLLSILLTMAMVLSLVPAGFAEDIKIVDTEAAEEQSEIAANNETESAPVLEAEILDEEGPTSGKCGENVTWTLDENGTLTISGTGDMWDYSNSNQDYSPAPWFEIRSSVRSLAIDSGVTHIGNCAFCDCINLSYINIPDGVLSIGDYAFDYCVNLKNVILSKSVTNIGYCAFENCYSLLKVTIPAQVKTIGPYAFCRCKKLEIVTIPESVASIEIGAFAECESLKTIVFLGDAPAFGESCFLAVTATAYHPDHAEVWTDDVMQDYGGDITWEAFSAEDVIPIDEDHFPDEKFRSFVQDRFDLNGDEALNGGEIYSATALYLDFYKVSSLEGLSYFTELEILSCWDCGLTELDVSKNTKLKSLSCEDNALTELNISNNAALEELVCYDNQLTELDVSGCPGLQMLNCCMNQLTALDVTKNSALIRLNCGLNQLTELDVTYNPALEVLLFDDNQLETIDITKNSKLMHLVCSHNPLTGLELSGNPALQILHCINTQLTELDLSANPELFILNCYHNNIAELDIRPCQHLDELVRIVTKTSVYGEFQEKHDRYLGLKDFQYRLEVDQATNLLAGEPLTFTLDQRQMTIPVGESAVITAKLSNGRVLDCDELSFYSSDEEVATVDDTGTLTAHKYGSCWISVNINGSRNKKDCNILVQFKDVTDSSKYYYEPVYWAADNEITVGYTSGEYAGMFGVGQNCERRQLMLFLWRYAGSPTKDKNGKAYPDAKTLFNDVGAYGASSGTNKAIAWAYTEGIAKGYKDGGFHPTDPIVRKDVMIMLYRLAGKPAVSGTLSFPDCKDMKPGTDTYNAILWGVQKGITKGYSSGEYAGQFGTNLDCLREQIVTFLYRYASKFMS